MTPIYQFDGILLKREDQNTTGSAKDRAIQAQVDHLSSQNFHQAVISSTGNAAISAYHFCQSKNINLHIFISPKIDQKKLIHLQSSNLHFSPKPISQAIKFAKTNSAYLLRPATDPVAIKAYGQIGREILSQQPRATSIFVAAGSGATYLGIRQSLPSHIKIYPIQPAANPTIAKYFDKNFAPESENITDALTVKTLPLRRQIISSLEQTNSISLAVQKQQIVQAQKILLSQKITTSNEGALALAGFYKAKNLNLPVGEFPVIILTGSSR